MKRLRKKYTFKEFLVLLIGHWQWFILSVVICLCAAFLYTLYVTPVYQLTGKLLIKTADTDKYHYYSSKRLLSRVQTVGTVSKTNGVENEAEILWSTKLMQDVVKQLKLYTTYQEEGRLKDQEVYATQPINVDLDPAHLDTLDDVAEDEFRSIQIKMIRQSDSDSIIIVKGFLYSEDEAVWGFSRRIKNLPAVIDTPYGTLTFTRNPNGTEMKAGHYWLVTIDPPLYHALLSLGNFSVTPANKEYITIRDIARYYFKMSSIVNMTYLDKNVKRGIDILKQIAISYNRMANADKNEIALCVEDFINRRITSLSEELGSADNNIADIMQEGGLTSLRDAASVLKESDSYSTKLMETATQSMIIDDLNAYITDPAHKDAIIPSSIGLTDKATIQLIDKYNALVQQRNRLLLSASEEAAQVKQLNATIAELHSSIISALKQAKHTTDISHKAIRSQFSNFRGQVKKAPTMEHALKDVGRELRVKSRLYILLLQKREENIIALSSTADHGKLIDEPLCEGRVRPRLWMVYGLALAAGLGIPYAVLIAFGLLRYKLENLEELKQLTELPVIASVPTASEADKGKAGIVVHDGKDSPIDEVFRLMRTNLFFMMRGERHLILFTSTTSGEGKTFNAANLAVTYALTGKKVILCGLDIRKPALGILFGIADRGKGISTLLTKDIVTKEDILSQVQPSGVDDHLDLLLAGSTPPNPTELLARDSLRQVFEILRDTYDYVILDTAPVGLVTDTLQVSKLADVTVYVCRADYTPKYSIAQLNGLVEEKKLNNPCIVLNGCDPK